TIFDIATWFRFRFEFISAHLFLNFSLRSTHIAAWMAFSKSSEYRRTLHKSSVFLCSHSSWSRHLYWSRPLHSHRRFQWHRLQRHRSLALLLLPVIPRRL